MSLSVFVFVSLLSFSLCGTPVPSPLKKGLGRLFIAENRTLTAVQVSVPGLFDGIDLHFFKTPGLLGTTNANPGDEDVRGLATGPQRPGSLWLAVPPSNSDDNETLDTSLVLIRDPLVGSSTHQVVCPIVTDLSGATTRLDGLAFDETTNTLFYNARFNSTTGSSFGVVDPFTCSSVAVPASGALESSDFAVDGSSRTLFSINGPLSQQRLASYNIETGAVSSVALPDPVVPPALDEPVDDSFDLAQTGLAYASEHNDLFATSRHYIVRLQTDGTVNERFDKEAHIDFDLGKGAAYANGQCNENARLDALADVCGADAFAGLPNDQVCPNFSVFTGCQDVSIRVASNTIANFRLGSTRCFSVQGVNVAVFLDCFGHLEVQVVEPLSTGATPLALELDVEIQTPDSGTCLRNAYKVEQVCDAAEICEETSESALVITEIGVSSVDNMTDTIEVCNPTGETIVVNDGLSVRAGTTGVLTQNTDATWLPFQCHVFSFTFAPANFGSEFQLAFLTNTAQLLFDAVVMPATSRPSDGVDLYVLAHAQLDNMFVGNAAWTKKHLTTTDQSDNPSFQQLQPDLQPHLLAPNVVAGLPKETLLVITELNAPGEKDRHYVEVHNPTGASVSVDGWTLRTTSVDAAPETFTIGDVDPIAAGGFAVFGRNGNPAGNGGVTMLASFGEFDLLTPSGEISLWNDEGALVDYVQYTIGNDTATASEKSFFGDGDTNAQLRSTTNAAVAQIDNNHAVFWCSSSLSGRTPNAHSACEADELVLVNEVRAHNSNDDVVELFNPNPFDVDLAGWSIEVDGTFSFNVTNATSLIIQPFEYLVIDPVDSGGPADPFANGGGEAIQLVDPSDVLVSSLATDSTGTASDQRFDPFFHRTSADLGQLVVSLGITGASATLGEEFDHGFGWKSPTNVPCASPAFSGDFREARLEYAQQSQLSLAADRTLVFAVSPDPSIGGGAGGDPHIAGLRGQAFDFDGSNGDVYNLVCDDDLLVNFLADWGSKKMPTVMTAIGVRVGDARFAVFANGTMWLDGALVDDAAIDAESDRIVRRELASGTARLTWARASGVETPAWDVALQPLDATSLQLNHRAVFVVGDRYRFAFDVVEGGWIEVHAALFDKTARPHGVLGQTAWHDVDGGRDFDMIGVESDYLVASHDLFDGDVKFNPFWASKSAKKTGTTTKVTTSADSFEVDGMSDAALVGHAGAPKTSVRSGYVALQKSRGNGGACLRASGECGKCSGVAWQEAIFFMRVVDGDRVVTLHANGARDKKRFADDEFVVETRNAIEGEQAIKRVNIVSKTTGDKLKCGDEREGDAEPWTLVYTANPAIVCDAVGERLECRA